MIRLIRELCMCLAVTFLLLVGATVVLLLIKAAEGYRLIAGNTRVPPASIFPSSPRTSLLSTKRLPVELANNGWYRAR